MCKGILHLNGLSGLLISPEKAILRQAAFKRVLSQSLHSLLLSLAFDWCSEPTQRLASPKDSHPTTANVIQWLWGPWHMQSHRLARGQKGTPKPQNHTNDTKNFLQNSRALHQIKNKSFFRYRPKGVLP